MATTDNTIQILNMLSDTNVCDVLKTVYAADNSGVDFANQAKLPPTKIYPLISMLQEQHLIEKRNRKYFITIIGRAVYNTKGLIEKALRHYCKLKVIDSLIEQQDIPVSELHKVIDTLIDDYQLKDILIKD
jgi:predicted transcriptional regulator